jgi:hypothetical protein
MQVRCVKAFSGHVPGDVVEVPDGAAVSPVYFEPLPHGDPPPRDDPPPSGHAPVPVTPVTAAAFGQLPKGM